MILTNVGKLPLNRNVHRLNSGHTARLPLPEPLAVFGTSYVYKMLYAIIPFTLLRGESENGKR
jgi:hypothetical protein